MNSVSIYKQGMRIRAVDAVTSEVIKEGPDVASIINTVTADMTDGGAVIIEPGIYEIHQPIQLMTRVAISGRSRSTVLCTGSHNGIGVIIYGKDCDAAVVEQLELRGTPGNTDETGILLEGCGDCDVRSVAARDFGKYGVCLQKSCFLIRVNGTVTSGCGRAGIALIDNAKKGRAGQYIPNLISGCTSMGERGSGVFLDDTLCTNIVGCQIFQPSGPGIHIRNTSNSICISGCRIFQGKQHAVLVQNSHELNITGNIFCWHEGHGIELDNVVWGVICGNNIIDSGAKAGPRTGLVMHTDTKSMQVTGNALFNWQGMHPMDYGIYESEDCKDNSIVANTVQYFSGEAVRSDGGSFETFSAGIAAQYPWPREVPFPTEPEHVDPDTAPISTAEFDQYLAGEKGQTGKSGG